MSFKKLILPIKCQCCPHIETSQLICGENQLTGFYMVSIWFSLRIFLVNVTKSAVVSVFERSRG